MDVRNGPGTAARRVEAVIFERYPQLVRLAYLTLPVALDRHARVLRAHRAVQQALRGAGRRAGQGDDPVAAVRGEVVRRAAGRARPQLPWVWGLRMWPVAEELDAAARELAALGGYARAGHVLCRWDGLSTEEAVLVLRLAGAAAPEEELQAGLAVTTAGPADGSGTPGDSAGATLSHPAQVHTRPTDLMLRRTRVRALGAAAGALALGTALVLLPGGDGPGPAVPYAGAPAARAAADPDRLVRVAAQAWSDTGRVDFTAWPARGDRTGDQALLTRALGTWAAPPSGTALLAAPATSTEPPSHPPQLLFAGDAGPGTAVVVLLDGDRLARYTEHAGRRSLDLARVDDANVTTAASLVLTRRPDVGTEQPGAVRHLLAPWIASAGSRELTAPDAPLHRLRIGTDGTVAVPAGGKRTGCDPAAPVLEVASSVRIVEKHSFLLADLGGLLPVHLTYTPQAEGTEAARARQPREATGPVGRARWSQEACALKQVDGRAVRAVNLWDFATSELPEGAGRAVWSCLRATHWTGSGDVSVQLRPPTGAALTAARERATAACGRFGQHILAGTAWRAASGHWYQLAAGSREVAEITLTGSIHAHAKARTLAAPAAPPGAPRPHLTARLHSGTTLTALDGATGGRD
ncbi:hypothetical protein [Streptomyces sp. NPDC089919]|uniref:hypothetical protein n=1 Tax=Streptomyces sp. NPDC089919 TaxID=3155188 RepID=UPI0034130FF7